VQIQDDVGLPVPDELMNGRGFFAPQQLMIAVQVNPVRVQAGPRGTTIRVCLRNDSELQVGQPSVQLAGRHRQQRLDRPLGRPFVPVLAGQQQDAQWGVGAATGQAEDCAVLFGVAKDLAPGRGRRLRGWGE
jgi:hypothetical protein